VSTRTKGIGIYLVIALGGAWASWAVAWLLGALDTGPRGQALVAAGAFAPALAAVIVRAFVTREGFADAGLRPRFRHAWPYYLFAWLLPLPVVGIIVVLARLLGLGASPLSLSPALIIGAAVGALVAAPLFIGEEFGWRGYLQPRLFGGRPLPAALLTGLIWGVFHWPLILVGYEGYENVILGLAIFPVFTMLYSLVLGWLRARSGTVWVACVGHAAANGSGGALTAALFLHGGHFVLLSYAGVLAWIPLGALGALLILGGQLRRSPARPPRSDGPLGADTGALASAASRPMA
jgi:membrane protease YdiL (CAAX protease family)